MTRQFIDDTQAELEQLYRERDRLRSAEPPTVIRRERRDEQLTRVESCITRLEASRA